MGYLRLVRSLPTPPQAAEDACVQAFDRELDYVFAILRRLGVPPAEVEDLAHDVFVVLHRNWPTLDTERPLRPYLFGVAFRIVSARRRKRSRESPQEAPDMKDDGAEPRRIARITRIDGAFVVGPRAGAAFAARCLDFT